MRGLGNVQPTRRGVVVLLGLFLGGAAIMFWGFAGPGPGPQTYRVDFMHEGDGCVGDGDPIMVNVDDGEPLDCLPRSPLANYGTPAVDLPGFTDAENKEVLDLSENLGADGISDAERPQLQTKVDQITASLPPDLRPHHHPFLWGGQLVALGLVVMAVPFGLYAYALFKWRSV